MVESDIFSSDALTVLVWVLRMVLPCLLFWISFGPRLRWPWRFHQHPKDVMLAHREIVKAAGEPPPQAVANLITVDAQTAPMLFQDTTRRASRTENSDRPERERGERGNRHRGHDRRERKRQPEPEVEEPPVEVQAAQSEQNARQRELDDHMYWESLVNFVAFGHHEQQRCFLPDAHSPPPPPPRPQKAPTPTDPEAQALLAAAIERANAEAQMVLRGAIQAGPGGLIAARTLHRQLVDHDIEVMPLTFELIIESCIKAQELRDASDFLMCMEANGQTPSNDLLDRVMELYLQHKRTESDDKLEGSFLHQSRPAAEASTAPKDKLPLASFNSRGTGNQVVDNGHMLDVASLKRLVVQQPPPPPPPPVRPVPVHTPVYGGHGVAEYDHVMNHAMPVEMHALMSIFPWQARMPNRTMRHHPQVLPIPSPPPDRAKLPAFSIPDEFAVQHEPEELPEEPDAQDTAADKTVETSNDVEADGLFPAAKLATDEVAPAEGEALGAGAAADLDNGSERPATLAAAEWTFSKDAAEFVPNEAPCETAQFLAAPGRDSHGAPYAAAPELWPYTQQDDSTWRDPSMASDAYGSSGFEWSVQAPVFTPQSMGGGWMLSEAEQAALRVGLRPAALPFVPGMPMPSVRPPVPISVGTVREEAYRSDDELWHEGDDLDADCGFENRQLVYPSGNMQDRSMGKGRGDGAARLAMNALASLGQPRPRAARPHDTLQRAQIASAGNLMMEQEDEANPDFWQDQQDLTLLDYPHPQLRAPNAEVVKFDKKLKKLTRDMLTLMRSSRVVSLAAPQVGTNVRVLVFDPDGVSNDWLAEVVFCNPRILEYSGGKEVQEEGCLSFPGVTADVVRSNWIKVEYQNGKGRLLRRKIQGWTARIFQLEHDFLDGKLFIDRVAQQERKRIQPRLDMLIEAYSAANGGISTAAL